MSSAEPVELRVMEREGGGALTISLDLAARAVAIVTTEPAGRVVVREAEFLDVARTFLALLHGSVQVRPASTSAPALRTTCPHGHPYDEENTFLRRDGSRRCRACHRDEKNISGAPPKSELSPKSSRSSTSAASPPEAPLTLRRSI
jgi:hypothetical protein